MDKIGLAVVTYVKNYGSFLQSFATQKTIEKFGYQPEIISIDGVRKNIGKSRRKYFIKRVFNYHELKSYIVTLRGIVKNKTDRRYSENIAIRNKKFDLFSENNFIFSPVVSGWDALSEYCKGYNAVVVGSDQLWRPANIEGNFYTLNFVQDEINKISYSTSFGVSVLPKKQAEKAKYFLERINHLSVREESGKKLVKKLIGKDISVVCDPTMLLTSQEWDSLIEQKPIIVEPYVLCYFLGSNEQYLKFAKKIKCEKKIKIVGLVHCAGYNKNVDLYMDETPFDVGPLEFINLIKYAEYVLTDSFHCCVFSIIFQKNFFAFRRFSDNDKMSTNDRLVTLFDVSGISGRLLYGDEEITDNLLSNIDYSTVEEKLSLKREYSLRYFFDALREKQ